ncbi:MAG: D-glycero-beta-D-manno-heptose 1-phosphate adenylyltransferase [Chloroherpetonaceae bacterium]|nr:D-glycero-beta-D-manno-heptose 1-phosphate adenylyltransferase [Chthonomonadaceae bacterium]MDW8206483.1 D-glycero-beta-D-manno-heptose 1-phosphate adenylyltransferase [Chloroherpetonaceae bacterium]
MPVQAAAEKIVTRETLQSILEPHRQRGERIVFTNGCFDLLHIGHARYLAAARALGDLLVVGVNSDASVRALKGPDRPIVPGAERAELLAHLTAVDYVCLFDETRPDALIAAVRPQIHVKGGDYRIESLPETPVVRHYGGQVVILPLVEGRSTTALIERIRAIHTARVDHP